MRNCPICRSGDKEPIHRQPFVFPGLTDPTHYDVVHCRACGFIYAENPPPPLQNDYYSEATHHLHTVLPYGLSAIHTRFFEFISTHLPSIHDEGFSILNVGSAMGHFLAQFKRAGVQRVTGLDPSPVARSQAQQQYGINVHTGTIDHFRHEHPFGLITLCGVLEHLHDLHIAVERIDALLETGGHVFIAVPDAGCFGLQPPTEPFLEFAAEHIDFFTRDTLAALFTQHGFQIVACETQRNDFYNNHYLLALFRRTSDTAAALTYDVTGRTSVLDYIEHSRSVLARTAMQIAELVARQDSLVVWGAGSLTMRLCATTSLVETNLIAFIDRNPQLQGKKILGVPITTPAALSSLPARTVLIASTTYADEIERTLKDELHWPGRVIKINSE